MFGLKVPTGTDVIVEVRFTLTRGGPFVAWDGPPEATDSDVTGDLLACRNAVAYLWAAVDKGKLQADEMGFVSVPARVVALQDGQVFFDEKVTIGLTLPARPGDSPMSGFQLQREMLALLGTALATMQKAATEAVQQVSSASIAAIQVASATIEKISAASMSAIQEVSSAHQKTLERAHEGLDHMSASVAGAIKEVNTAHQKALETAHQALELINAASSSAIKDVGAAHLKAMEQAHAALTTVAASADKVTGLADKIFEDSRDRAQALVHEARKGATAAKPESPMAEQVKDLRAMTDLMMMVKSITEDKSDSGPKK